MFVCLFVCPFVLFLFTRLSAVKERKLETLFLLLSRFFISTKRDAFRVVLCEWEWRTKRIKEPRRHEEEVKDVYSKKRCEEEDPHDEEETLFPVTFPAMIDTKKRMANARPRDTWKYTHTSRVESTVVTYSYYPIIRTISASQKSWPVMTQQVVLSPRGKNQVVASREEPLASCSIFLPAAIWKSKSCFRFFLFKYDKQTSKLSYVFMHARVLLHVAWFST